MIRIYYLNIMKLLKPNLISGEVLTLIEEAKKEVVLVSPYVKISKWFRLVDKLKEAIKRGVKITFYVREGEKETVKEVEKLGLIPLQIKNLHSKIYFNEKYAVVSSLNLLLSSEINSLEIAYKTSNIREYNELCEYKSTYLKTNIEKEKIAKRSKEVEKRLIEDDSFVFKAKTYSTKWKNDICDELSMFLSRKVDVIYREEYCVETNNIYQFAIDKRTRVLKISGIFTQKEFHKAKTQKEAFIDETGMDISFFYGNYQAYNTIIGKSDSCFSDVSINNMYKYEQDEIVNTIVLFVKSVERFKKNNS